MRKGKRKLVAWPESLADTTAWERPKETKAKLIRRTRDADDGREAEADMIPKGE